MSGLYAITWSNDKEVREQALLTTKGGYPHVTLRYYGDKISYQELQQLARSHFDELTWMRLTVVSARVNSFKCGDSMRHDVLMEFDESGTKALETVRAQLPQAQYHDVKTHITHGIFETEADAKVALEKLTPLFPFKVDVTGVTID